MKLSVIIPALNEAGRIAETIARTRALGTCEIIVVDGGSDDGTLDAAAHADLRFSSPRGRAQQQNVGAAASQADVLLFLHADCWLTPGGFDAIRQALRDGRSVGGCFRQQIDARGPGYRMIEAGNASRVRLLQWAYGDQGIFVRRSVFERVGGFPEIELMEDLYLMKRLKREGAIRLVNHRLHVSPRRWQHRGLLRQTLRNWSFLALSHCGVSPSLLAARYEEIR